MFAIIFMLILISSTGGVIGVDNTNKEGRIFEDKINSTLECIKQMLKDGTEEFPSLETIKIGDFDFDLDDDSLRGKYEFMDTSIVGIPNFVAKELKFALLQLQLEFRINFNVSFKGSYKVDGRALDLASFKGQGDFDFNMGMDLFGKMRLGLKDGIKIDEMHAFAKALPNIHIYGLLNDAYMSSLISRQFNAIIDEVVNKNMEEISKILSPALKALINLILTGKRKSLEDCLKFTYEIKEIFEKSA